MLYDFHGLMIFKKRLFNRMIVEKVGSYNPPPPLCPYQHVYSTCVYLKKITISVLKYKPISQPYRQG